MKLSQPAYRERHYRGYYDYLLARASIRRGDITEVPMCTSVIRTAGVTVTGID